MGKGERRQNNSWVHISLLSFAGSLLPDALNVEDACDELYERV